MIFKERYESILKTEKEVREILGDNIEIENNVIETARILVTGHFGNTVSLSLQCPNVNAIPLYNSTDNIGYIMRAIIEILDKENDDSVDFVRTLTATPIRLIFDNNRCVGIGHFMKDRFVLTEELMKIKE